MLRLPTQNRSGLRRISHQPRWIAGAARLHPEGNIKAGNLLRSFDHFFNRIAMTRAQVETIRLAIRTQIIQSENVGPGQVGYMT
jgi:hypothetical protein